MVANLHYYVRFGKLDGSGPLDWEVDLSDEEAVVYEEAKKLRKPFKEYPALEKPLERAYDEILEHELELFKEGGEEYWGDTYTECAGEYPVEEDELTELVHKRDKHTLEFLHLTDLSNEELDAWDACDLDELPNVCDFDPNFEFKNPFEWYWDISVRYAKDPESVKLGKTEATKTIKSLLKSACGDYGKIADFVSRCDVLYSGESLLKLSIKVAEDLELDDYVLIADLEKTPAEKLSQTICLDAIKLRPQNIKYVPERFITEELSKLAIEGWKNAWKYVPEACLNNTGIYNAVCDGVYKTVMADSYAFQFVPDRLKTKKICLAALCSGKYYYQNGEKNLKKVPEAIKDEDFYSALISANAELFKLIPQNQLTHKLCMEYASKGRLEGIPDEMISREMCITAININGLAIGRVPERLIDEELCLSALRKNRDAIERIPRKMINEEMCKEYISTARYLSSWYDRLPQELLTQELCLEMIKRDPVSMHLIPEKFRSEEVCLICLACNPNQLDYVPRHLRTKEFYEKAKEANPQIVIPDE